MILEVSPETARPLLDAWASIKPAFTMSSPPSFTANQKLVKDIYEQSNMGTRGQTCVLGDAINPFNERCWTSKAKLMHLYLSKGDKESAVIEEFMHVQERMLRFAEKEEMNVMVIVMPQSSRWIKEALKPYGAYSMPSQAQLGRRQQVEEPITETLAASPSSPMSHTSQAKASDSSDDTRVKHIIPLCHSSFNSCTEATNNCSGHGVCFRKYGSDGAQGNCYTCGCIATVGVKNGTDYTKTTNWGGSACSKKDVSGPFWLISIFSVVMVGVVSWAIGLLFSIGEEKLPGVIGAGVSGAKAR
jgi:hypothetical protein